MKKLLACFFLCAVAQIAWTQTLVTTDSDIRAAVLINNVTIQLTGDINLSNSTLSIPANHTVTIDLNGYKLDRRLSKRGEGGGTVITVRNGATLHISNGTLTGGWGGAGGALSNENGTVFLTDVILTDNVADDRGGGICNYGTMTIIGGEITDNSCNDRAGLKGGGGLFNSEGATARLVGVTISSNEVKVYGGGGICNYGTIELDSCTISGNTATTYGGGIWENGTLKLKGANLIKNNHNKSGKADNIYFKSGRVATVTGELAGSDIHVTMEKTTGTFTTRYNDHHNTVEPATFFTPDLPAIFDVILNNNEAEMVYKSSISYVECSWNARKKEVTHTLKTLTHQIGQFDAPTSENDYKVITSGSSWFQLGGYSDGPEYYVVRGNVTYGTFNQLGKDVHLILCDGAKLTLSGGLLIYGTKSLKIYSQSYGAEMGQFVVTSGYKDEAAGIGSDYDGNSSSGKRAPGDIEIHGGKLNITGGDKAAGIGGGFHQQGGNLTIYGGDIKAYGGNSNAGGAGIGGTHHGGGHIIIYGGKVYASGAAESAGIGAGRNVNNDLTALPDEYIGVMDDDAPKDETVDAVSIVTIYGGEVEAHGGNDGAGIGGGVGSNGVILSVYGGNVKAYGGDDAAGIGGGWHSNGGLTIIRGGTVYAKGSGNGAGIGSGSEEILQGNIHGGTTLIYDGKVEAYGGTDAAGIGGGEDADGGKIVISGGEVLAQGGDYGAGIGGGQGGDGADVTITGGIVIAKAGRNETGLRAIGPGEGDDDYGSLTLGDDMMVSSERKATAAERKNMCWYRTQVRVEPCDHSGQLTYTVDGTTAAHHHISHCPYCLHSDTELHTFDEHGVCTVCGVQATAYAVRLYMPQAVSNGAFDGRSYGLTHTHLVVPDSVFRLPMATLQVPGYTFIGWEAAAISEDTYTSPYTTVTADTLYRVGNRYTITKNIAFVARYQVADITLYDDQPNGETLAQYNGMTASKVTLYGRAFNKDNTWQSIALPFSLSADELAASPLAGCTLKELDTDSSYNDTENKLVYLYFKDTTAIAAGKPYIIRWAEGDPILSPVFTNVTLTNKTADDKGKLLLFKSLYSPQTFTSANTMVLYFNENGLLVSPDGETPVTVGAFRAYFRLTNLMGGDGTITATITSNIDFPQGIDNVSAEFGGSAKIIRNGLLFIERNGRIYDAQGKLVD